MERGRPIPAPFAASLCGYRNGKPNTSDASHAFSVELGTAFFDVMGVPRAAVDGGLAGPVMAREMLADLAGRVESFGSDVSVDAERKLAEFEQYSHLGVVQELAKDPAGSRVSSSIEELEVYIHDDDGDLNQAPRLLDLVGRIRGEHEESVAERRLLLDTLGEESVLGLDIAISGPSPYSNSSLPFLEAGFSLKWSLRTDRAQDCRTQGAKMAALRRGRMPHFAAVTMEPRPYFLGILGRGSGEIDCVYHLHLPALAEAVDQVCTSKNRMAARDTFHRLRDQGRVRDYDDLIAYVSRI
nr:NgoMIV family type II restriction endonuclease [Nocardiopsis mwathae]